MGQILADLLVECLRIGISIRSRLRRQDRRQRLTKPVVNRRLTKMAERRVADVMQ